MPYDRSDYRDKWRIERLAAGIRGRLGLDQLRPLSAWRFADAIPAHIFYPEDFGYPDLAQRMRLVEWDAFAFCCPGERTLMIVLNPSKPKTRQTATLMEEFAHHILGHEPCRIQINKATGFLERSYDKHQEAEAYDLGSALLLPKERIQRDIRDRRTAAEIAAEHACSDDIVIYRIKRMRLWKQYDGYQVPSRSAARARGG